jgi:predicted permease
LIYQVLNIIAPLFLIVGVGYFYGARVRPEMRITNQLIMDVFMPALIFSVMIRDDFHAQEYVLLVAAGALLMIASGALAFIVARVVGFPWRTFVPPAMFSNWANLGIPLYVFTLGDIALGGGVMLVVLGNVMCFTIGTYIYSGKLSGFEVLRTPVIMAVIFGGAISALDFSMPLLIVRPVEMLGQVTIPLMLFSLGVRLTRVGLKETPIGLAMALFCPIVGVPLAILLSNLLELTELHRNILILFGVLPPAVVNFMLAEQHGRDPEKIASMVMLGNLLALISIPIVLYFMLAGS